MNKPWKLILLLVGIFIAGGVTGGFVTLRLGRELLAKHRRPEQWAPMHLKRLTERLDLKPEQQEELRPIVRRNMEDLNHLRTTAMAETKRIFERMEREITEKLTPEQRVKFEQMNKEFREKAKRFTDRQPGRDRPAGEPGKPAAEPPPAKTPSGG